MFAEAKGDYGGIDLCRSRFMITHSRTIDTKTKFKSRGFAVTFHKLTSKLGTG